MQYRIESAGEALDTEELGRLETRVLDELAEGDSFFFPFFFFFSVAFG